MTKFIIITTEVGKGQFVASTIPVGEDGVPLVAHQKSSVEVSRAVAKDRLLAKIAPENKRIPVGKTWRLE
jgi:hypothetical protein